MSFVALALPVAAAVLLARAYWPGAGGVAFRALQACIAAGCGLALSSCVFFLWYPFFGHPKHAYPAIETVVCLMLIAVAGRRLLRGGSAPTVAPADRSWTRWLWVPFAASAVAAGGYLSAYTDREPHGHWDAFSIWNLRARFLFRSDDDWPNTFSRVIFHADYPLFVPATVARVWCYASDDATAVPVAVAVLMMALTVGTLVAGLNVLRGGGQGWLAGAVLLTTFPFVQTAGVQYADVPVAFFILAAVVILAVRDQAGGRSRWPAAVAGAVAGFAAWTKNEGLLFLAALVLCRVIVHARRRSWRDWLRELIPFLLAALPAGLALVVLKLGFAPPNDLVAGQGGGTLARLLDGQRHAQVCRAVAAELWAVGPFMLVVLGAYAVLVGRPPVDRRHPGRATPWLVLAAVAVGYYLVYVTTPHDLAWHLSTSLTRLLAQLWPLFLFALFLTVDTLDDAPVAVVRPA